MAGTFEIYQDKGGEYRFRLKASNGQSILASEGYKTKASCLNGVESVKTNAPDDARYEKKESGSGKFMFNLKAANHQVIGTSQQYQSGASRDKGIESVKNHAREARVVEVDAPSRCRPGPRVNPRPSPPDELVLVPPGNTTGWRAPARRRMRTDNAGVAPVRYTCPAAKAIGVSPSGDTLAT